MGRKRKECFPGTSIRIDRETPITDPNYGQDLCRALSQLRERRGDVRAVVSDPPLSQTPPLSAVRYPSPPAIRLIRSQQRPWYGLSGIDALAVAPVDDGGNSIDAIVDYSVRACLTTRCPRVSYRGREWGDEERAARLRSEDACKKRADATQRQQLQTGTRKCAGGGRDRSRSPPLMIRDVPIRGCSWGDELSVERRKRGIMQEMEHIGEDIFKIRKMIHSGPTTNSGGTLKAVISRMNILVDDSCIDPMFFKIGITWNPPHRWANRRYGYAQAGGSHMEILICDPDSRIIGVYESSLITHFQGHDKCLNIKDGDDNRQNVSPHYLYVVVGPDRF